VEVKPLAEGYDPFTVRPVPLAEAALSRLDGGTNVSPIGILATRRAAPRADIPWWHAVTPDASPR
jgi:hypothetical protein